jgi:hypothetical protein
MPSLPRQLGRLDHLQIRVRLVLFRKTESAEVFAQLVRRAEKQRDYKRIDLLADA